MAALDPVDAMIELWRDAGLDDEALDDVGFTGSEPALPSSFAVGTAAQATIGAAALAAAELWRLRTGRRQRVSVEMRSAAIEFRSERYLRVDGRDPDDHHDQIAGVYRCGDGRWARLHTNLPHHRDGLLRLLGCNHDKTAVQRALERWSAEKLETIAAEAGLVVTACRSFDEWDAHAQGGAVASLPLFSIEKIGEGPVLKLAPAERPLSGVKVLELTHVIAGPVSGRVLAAHGADVLLVTAAHRPSMLPLVIDTGRGKLSTHIDLRQPNGREKLTELVREADIFIQGYRPGAVAAHGFTPEGVARLRPGIVYASLSAYGHEGPWALRRGFDSLVQTATGLNLAEAVAFGSSAPRPLPAQALDHATGYLLAFVIMAALERRAGQGGSWQVRASLAQTGHWLRQLGRIDGMHCRDLGFDDVRDRLRQTPSGFGLLTAVHHAAELSETPPHWSRPSAPLGTHAPIWSG